MNIKKYILTLILLTVLMVYSCGECGLVEAEYPCRVREATVTRFDPRLETDNDTTYFPVPTYSIHTFTFPSDNASSGVLSNDNRFDENKFLDQYITIAQREVTLNRGEFLVKLVSFQPPNNDIVGDLMVIAVDSTASPMTARLRFFGSLSRFPDDFLSENANRFCNEYLPNYREQDEDYKEISSRASRYGRNLTNAVSESFDTTNIVVVNSAGRDVTGARYDDVPQNVIDDLLASQTEAIDVVVTPGEVYYYKARNGKEFAVVIVDIHAGRFPPHLKRVTIKFSELRGAKKEECPD